MRTVLFHAMRAPHVGDTAPDFTLEGTGGMFTPRRPPRRARRAALLPGRRDARLHEAVLLLPRPREDIGALDAVVVGISPQDLASHEAFTSHHGLTVPLLADVDKAVARAYGVLRPVLGTQRAAFVVDESGRIAWRKLHALGLDYVGVDELRAALAGVASAREAAEARGRRAAAAE